MLIRAQFYLMLFLSICSQNLLAEQELLDLTKAMQLYDQNQGHEAVVTAQTWMRGHHANGYVLYNLGNFHFRDGEPGKAIAALLAARALLPRDPNIKANLRFLHQQISDKVDITPPESTLESLIFWKNWFTHWEIYTFALYLFALSFLLGAFAYFLQPLLFLKYLTYTGLFIGFLLTIAGFVSQSQMVAWGAVAVKKADVYSGPAQSNTVLFILSEGAPYMIENQTSEWVQIKLSDGKVGWLSRHDGFDYFESISPSDTSG